MRARGHDLEGLVELPSIRDPAVRKAGFRQALANLARAASEWGPSPLEGIPPLALMRGVRVALDAGLFDELDWLSPAAVGVAMYELGAALPQGLEKRELGRRVIARVQEATAETFAAVATRMARGSRKGLSGASIRARVSLLLSTPIAAVDAGPLAFALVSRRELAREWIVGPSTGSLAARRLASRILERAAVFAARRASEGDDYAPRVFSTEAVGAAFARLLADREPLVWRRAAVARGVLAGVAPPHWKAVLEGMHPRLTPTEWRRAAVSIVAAIATASDRAAARAHDLIGSTVAGHDRGVVATMIYGMPRALDAEPELAEELLDAIVDADPDGAADALATVAHELGGDAGRRAIATARVILGERVARAEGEASELLVAKAAYDELDPERRTQRTLRASVARAMSSFVERGAREAHAEALAALDIAREAMTTLEGVADAPDSAAWRTSVLLVRDLDAGLLEAHTIDDLLLLGGARGLRDGHDEARAAALQELHDRLGRYLLSHERHPPERNAQSIAVSGRRLRALLHLLDAEGGGDDDDAGAPRIHARRVEAAAILFARLIADARSPLHRTVCATLARALDALVRDGACEPVDLLLVTAARLDDSSDLGTLAEAIMNPDVEALLRAYARFVRAAADEEPVPLLATGESRPPPSLAEWSTATDERISAPIASRIESILELAAALADDGSGRAEGLRAVLVKLSRALRTVASVPSRRALEAAASAFETLTVAAHAYAQIEAGAQRRVLGHDDDAAPPSTAAIAQSSRLAAQLGRLAEPDAPAARAAVDETVADLRRLLPPPLLRVVADVLQRAAELPFQDDAADRPRLVAVPDPLPAWLGPRRTIGGFYVVRPLGGGAAASVFVAKRVEERNDPSAEQFALKVPDYDGGAARALSEREFLEFFRAEATALLGLPPDPNLARFVTFDLAARPKPILVMELIEGPTLERFVGGAESARDGRTTTAKRAFELLDGVLAGLEVMHRHAIGHLDLKPSNVVLRNGETPALVDFGLAGRVLRPGCATGPYGAPEVWGVVPDDMRTEPSPMAADVYAFGALAFEVLTGEMLFDADSEVAIVSKHLVHDGHPEPLERLAHVRPLVELLQHTLRRDPRARWSVPQVRSALRAIAKVAGGFPWPLSA